MPINAPVEYFKAEEKYLSAKTREEKIRYLEEMIRLLPKHKGTSNLLSQLRGKLAKLKKEVEKEKKARKGKKSEFTIKKEGAGRACILGLTNSGKSTLLKMLTGIDVEIAPYEYTTTKPEVGMMKYEDVWIQVIEIPSTFTPEVMNLIHGCDVVLMVLDTDKNIDQQKKALNGLLERHRTSKKFKILHVIPKKGLDVERLKIEIWNSLRKIRVYTKKPGKKSEEKPIVLREGSTVEDAVKEVHGILMKHFRFARVWGKSVRFGSERVGLDHVLSDKDVIQIYA